MYINKVFSLQRPLFPQVDIHRWKYWSRGVIYNIYHIAGSRSDRRLSSSNVTWSRKFPKSTSDIFSVKPTKIPIYRSLKYNKNPKSSNNFIQKTMQIALKIHIFTVNLHKNTCFIKKFITFFAIFPWQKTKTTL